MRSITRACHRRRFLESVALGASFFATRGLFASGLDELLTPNQTEGPFYPSKLPLDTDNDLLIVNESITPAVGQITHLSGQIKTKNGSPIRNALVEIWQVDNHGVYLHPQSANFANRDSNFQGFGRFLTGSNGEYYFRTIKPVLYPGRTPHIHFKIRRGDQELLTTQCYVKGEAANQRDFVLKNIQDRAQRDSVLVDFAAVPGSKIGELAARFDITLGITPEA